MKTFRVNIQTILVTTELTILAAFNRHTGVLAYNKPLVDSDELDKIIKLVETDPYDKVTKTFQTDNFGVNFYDYTTGGTSEFHEVVDKAKELV